MRVTADSKWWRKAADCRLLVTIHQNRRLPLYDKPAQVSRSSMDRTAIEILCGAKSFYRPSWPSRFEMDTRLWRVCRTIGTRETTRTGARFWNLEPLRMKKRLRTPCHVCPQQTWMIPTDKKRYLGVTCKFSTMFSSQRKIKTKTINPNPQTGLDSPSSTMHGLICVQRNVALCQK